MKILLVTLIFVSTVQFSACSTTAVIPENAVTLEALDCSQEEQLKSESFEVKSRVMFTNTSSNTVALRWINYQGERDTQPDQLVQIQPGKSTTRDTFLTHPFVVTDTAGTCLSIYLPEALPDAKINLALIK